MEFKPSNLWKDVRRWLPGVIISVIALYVVLRVIRWQDLLQALSAFNPGYVAIACCLTVVYLVVRGMASRTLLEGKVTFRQAFLTINVGYLLNNIFPLRAGEVGRAILLGQTSGLGTMHVLSTIVIERAFDLAIAAGLLLSTLPLALGMDQARPVAIVTLLLVIAGLVFLFLMARFQATARQWAAWLGKRIPIIEKYLLPQFDALLAGLSVLARPKLFLISLGWILVSWIIAVVEYYIMLLSLNAHPPFWQGAFVDAVLALGIAVPSAPGAIGVFEAAMVGALKLLGFSEASGLAYAVIIHFQQWIITGIFGIYGLTSEGRSLFSFFKDIRGRALSRNPD
jgi:glycosyltransferase 2 family protein